LPLDGTCGLLKGKLLGRDRDFSRFELCGWAF
jgi:hypothetical protein